MSQCFLLPNASFDIVKFHLNNLRVDLKGKWGTFLLNKYWLRFLRFKSAKEAYSVLQFC